MESFLGSGIEGSGIEGFHCICDDSSGHPYMFVVCLGSFVRLTGWW